jgi:DNA polymerase-3 subunit alpha
MRSRKGDRWAIATLQDMTGTVDILVFPEAFARLEGRLKSQTPLLFKGRINVEDAGTRVVVSDAKSIEDMAASGPSLLKVRVDLSAMDEFLLNQLQELLESSPGTCPVAFDLVRPDGSRALFETDRHVRADENLIRRIAEVCGADAVEAVR